MPSAHPPQHTLLLAIAAHSVVTAELAREVVECALRRGLTTVDLSFNQLSASDVGEVVEHASALLEAAAVAHPGRAPSLFLQMRQFSRR